MLQGMIGMYLVSVTLSFAALAWMGVSLLWPPAKIVTSAALSSQFAEAP
jgi:hypothetical protein